VGGVDAKLLATARILKPGECAGAAPGRILEHGGGVRDCALDGELLPRAQQQRGVTQAYSPRLRASSLKALAIARGSIRLWI
jgi:hypothetical protein